MMNMPMLRALPMQPAEKRMLALFQSYQFDLKGYLHGL
ncbi:hypothetical protein M2375_003887 [Comamonas sp. BIGb0152]|nr:hypothetical protein [Comamonas sp. BIGb0152]